jgi:hypothetical protein
MNSQSNSKSHLKMTKEQKIVKFGRGLALLNPYSYDLKLIPLFAVV